MDRLSSVFMFKHPRTLDPLRRDKHLYNDLEFLLTV